MTTSPMSVRTSAMKPVTMISTSSFYRCTRRDRLAALGANVARTDRIRARRAQAALDAHPTPVANQRNCGDGRRRDDYRPPPRGLPGFNNFQWIQCAGRLIDFQPKLSKPQPPSRIGHKIKNHPEQQHRPNCKSCALHVAKSWPKRLSGAPHSVHTSLVPIGYPHAWHRPRLMRMRRRTKPGTAKSSQRIAA